MLNNNGHMPVRVALKWIFRPSFRHDRRFIFGDESRPYRRNRVNLIYWQEGAEANVGDLLSKVIVESILHREGIDPEKAVRGQKQLAAIGSILDRIVLPCTVWGSG